MAPSTPASASAELASVAMPELGRRPRLGALVTSPAGAGGAVLTALMIGVAMFGPVFTTVDPFAISGAPLLAPSAAHILGTDALGRDLLSGVLHGARTSVMVAAGAAILALLCGMTIGMIAGYRGGWVDDVLMRLTELLQVLPRFFLVVVVGSLFGPGIALLALLLGLTSWPVLARVVRGEVLAMRQLDFVHAAEATGASPVRVLWHELLPNVLPSALVLAGLLFGQALLVEASIGFLGLGDPNAMSWGMLAGQAQSYLRVAWWLPLFPGLAITLSVLGANLLADSMAGLYRGQ